MRSVARRRPLYSACNEDSRSEIRALDIGPDDTVCAIAAGGGRVLSLLTANPARVVAIDFHVDQLHVLDLKAAALQELPYEAFRGFLGLDPGTDRRELYAFLRPVLSASARRYWDRRLRLIEAGILYCGRLEHTLSSYTRTLRAVGLFKFPEIYFGLSTLEEQHLLLRRDQEKFDRGGRFWALLCNRIIAYLAIQDPGFLRSTEGSTGQLLWSRLRRYGERHLFKDSFLLHLIYNGRYPPGGPFPLYLSRGGFEAARKNLNRLETRHERLETAVERPPSGGRRKWSLSDVSCWMSRPQFRSTLVALVDSSGPGDRFCYRNFAADRRIPEELLERVDLLHSVCASLNEDDSSVFFRFHAAEVRAGTPCEEALRS